MDRKSQREIALKIIYAMELRNDPDLDILNNILEEESLTINDADYCIQIVAGYINESEDLFNYVEKYGAEYPIKKLSTIDISILKLALVEIFVLGQAHQVAINEAVELAKEYSDVENYRLINSLLGTIIRGEKD